jgi:hypothetical protein
LTVVRGKRRLTVAQSRAARLEALILSIFNNPALVVRGREGAQRRGEGGRGWRSEYEREHVGLGARGVKRMRLGEGEGEGKAGRGRGRGRQIEREREEDTVWSLAGA